MPPHKWTDESRDASCYYEDTTASRLRRPSSSSNSSASVERSDDEADDEREAFCSGERPLIRSSGAAEVNDGCGPKTRHIFGFMGFLGFAVVYAMRVNLSVAIVAMVNQTAIPHSNSSVIDADTCPLPEPNHNGSNPNPQREGEFVWDEATQGLVLGSFFYGYVLTQVPGGRMAELYGGKKIYGYGVLVTAIFTLLTPLAAHWDLPLLVLVRILEGMGEGVTYPAMHAMLAHWIPPLERNKFAAVVYAGSNIGTVISMPLAGWLCSLDFLGGWPSAFYIFGLLGILWFVAWMYLVYDKPSDHPRISASEREYIERCLRLVNQDRLVAEEQDQDEEQDGVNLRGPQEKPIPWSSLLTSVPLWAILLTQCGQGWAFYTQLTELPTYMSNILHFDIQSNALLNAVPYLTSWFVGIACSALADWMLARRYISLLNSYKLWNTVASVVPSLGLIGIIYVGCDWVWVTFMLAGVGSFGGAVYAGNQMNHIALSPRYAGTMYGITNSAANICGFMAPYVIGLIINHRETLTQWHLVFWLAAGLNIGGNFIYLIFASAEEQSWSKTPAPTTTRISRASLRA
ncbi:putative inorganic phosphate cotransporter [Drosophila elegans]|uniref:putative inorganic phosphate cotransporter n=1 Tax=Drosophila elegans TaxID=30023 RepID=UPI0007E6679B|nr:putative inorganic phosphate cotransporter [Drosophila elegans]XP_017116102.1 putative inorganic phosphate cotransporter [Drosophila elegans]